MIIEDKLLVFIPARNLENVILETLNDIPESAFQVVTEFLVINDNSSDGTIELVQREINKFAQKGAKLNFITSDRRLGYGGVQKKAFQYANDKGFEHIIMLHGDNQYPSNKIETMYQALKKGHATMIFGSRMSGDPLAGNMPLLRYTFNIFLTRLENYFLGTSLSGFHSGFRGYNLKLLKEIDYKSCSSNFLFDTDIIIKLVQKNHKIDEFTIPTSYSENSSSINMLDSFKYVLGILFSILDYKTHCLKFRRSRKFVD